MGDPTEWEAFCADIRERSSGTFDPKSIVQREVLRRGAAMEMFNKGVVSMNYEAERDALRARVADLEAALGDSPQHEHQPDCDIMDGVDCDCGADLRNARAQAALKGTP